MKLLALSSVLVVLQNLLGVFVCKILHINPLIGIATGSIPMVGGHGTSAVFAPPLEELGLSSANTITLAAATFGLVAGALVGGPLGRMLILRGAKKNNSKEEYAKNIFDYQEEFDKTMTAKGWEQGIYLLLLAMALGTLFSKVLGLTGLTFPSSVGGMLASALLVNIKSLEKIYPIRHGEIQTFGNISLAIFLSMSMMKLKLWEIADLAGPMVILLLLQVVLIVVFIFFFAYPLMSGDYEAAVTCSGLCGYGLGAVPTGMANMNTLVESFGPAPQSFFIVPLVGSLFINVVNTFCITLFMNLV